MITGNYTFYNNSIILINSLSKQDANTFGRLDEDLVHIALKEQSLYKQYIIESHKSMLDVLYLIAEESKKGLIPLIHFESHGDAEKGLLIGATGEYISWPELTKVLAVINIHTGNNLVVFLTCCFGFHILKSIDIRRPAPFLIVIGSEEEVCVGKIDNVLIHFYKKFISGAHLSECISTLPDEYMLFQAEQFFIIAFIKYFRESCIGKNKKKRVEELVSIAKTKGLIKNRKELGKTRNEIKKNLKPDKQLFNKFANIFLHGKVSIKFDQVMTSLKGRNE